MYGDGGAVKMAFAERNTLSGWSAWEKNAAECRDDHRRFARNARVRIDSPESARRWVHASVKVFDINLSVRGTRLRLPCVVARCAVQRGEVRRDTARCSKTRGQRFLLRSLLTLTEFARRKETTSRHCLATKKREGSNTTTGHGVCRARVIATDQTAEGSRGLEREREWERGTPGEDAFTRTVIRDVNYQILLRKQRHKQMVLVHPFTFLPWSFPLLWLYAWQLSLSL